MSKSTLNDSLINDDFSDLERKTTFADTSMNRKSTFSRAFTFDGQALQSMAEPIRGITRTLTNYIDPDAQMTKKMINTYSTMAQKGNEGDVPLPPGFARKPAFWKLVFVSGLIAVFMGVVAALFMNITDHIPKLWVDCDFTEDMECGDFYNGEKWWIAITTLSGFSIGVIRFLFKYPDNLPGIFKDIQTFHVHPEWVPHTFGISAISLAGGATLGPEQALGNLGGGIATYVSEKWCNFLDQEYKNILVLCGMAGPLGALFPSPMLGALMMHELGEPPKTFMESTILLSISACISFAVFYSMVEVTWLEHPNTNSIGLSYMWLDETGYQPWQMGTAVVIGIVSACLCTCCLVTTGICKQIFFRIRWRLEKFPVLKEVVPPTIGGLIIGLVNYSLPATVGNGNLVLPWIVKYGPKDLPLKLLLSTGFARMFLLGVSMNSGFVGGIIFPFITMGLIAGAVACRHYPEIPVGLSMASFMISVPCAIVPMPFTFTALSCFTFFLGLSQTVPVFIASFVSYTIVCGSGFMKKLASRGRTDGGNETPQAEEPVVNQEADEFALKYLNKKGSNNQH